MENVHTTVVETEIPLNLLNEAKALVENGWFRSVDDIMLDALRRFLDSHRADLMEAFIRQDVEWGLHGNE
ncbi:MAG: CopG family transcriptional regulator [Anaerolineae bacterium]|nr:CopG family transcriptional regulator [Anaerolineae bacterium]